MNKKIKYDSIKELQRDLGVVYEKYMELSERHIELLKEKAELQNSFKSVVNILAEKMLADNGSKRKG